MITITSMYIVEQAAPSNLLVFLGLCHEKLTTLRGWPTGFLTNQGYTHIYIYIAHKTVANPPISNNGVRLRYTKLRLHDCVELLGLQNQHVRLLEKPGSRGGAGFVYHLPSAYSLMSQPRGPFFNSQRWISHDLSRMFMVYTCFYHPFMASFLGWFTICCFTDLSGW